MRARRAEIAAIKAADAERLAKLDAEAQKTKAMAAAAAEKEAHGQAQRRLTQIEKGNEIITSIFTELDIRKVKEGTEPLEAVLAERLVKAAGQLEGEAVGDPLVVAGLQVAWASRCSVWAIRGKRFRCSQGPRNRQSLLGE